MQDKALADFFLVGGTALALQIGHRHSYDLDLFINRDFDMDALDSHLKQYYGFNLQTKLKNTLLGRIESIKTDFISYKYPLIDKTIEEDGIRMYSIKDIAAMKLSAIASRGVKRDYYDLYFLLEMYSLEDMIQFFRKKFHQTEVFHILKSLTYFDDAEMSEEPKMITKVSWAKVKAKLKVVINNFFSE